MTSLNPRSQPPTSQLGRPLRGADFLSPVVTFNFLVLQWFFFRIKRDIIICEDGSRVHVGWIFDGPIWPLTGWWSEYRWVGGKQQ